VAENKLKKVYLEADIELHKETAALREKASKIINLPDEKNKQPDLQYFSAIFVSSGENLNHAYFLPSELVAAEGTIINKALDVEHKEDEIIGHIYERAFMDKDGNPLNISELASKETAEADKMEMHVAIAGILYKTRFPNIAEEVASGKWKVSMEAYYQDFDVKVGDMILNKREAEALGLASDSEGTFGKFAKVIKNGKEIAAGALARVLRGIVFSGCGIVKNPANPPSVILETAKSKEIATDDGVIVFTVDNDNKVTSIEVLEEGDKVLENKDKSALEDKDTVGICVSFKRRVYADTEPMGPNTEVIHENWCTLYDEGCTSFSRDTTDPDCLKNQRDRVVYVSKVAKAYATKLLNKKEKDDKREVLVDKLVAALDKAAKYQRRR
jgi:hypothetical protein